MSNREKLTVAEAILRFRRTSSLFGCDLSGLDFSGRDFNNGQFVDVDLRRANLTGADLSGTQFSGVDVAGARFVGADLCDTRFVDTNLAAANLEPIRGDVWEILDRARDEVPVVLDALRAGRVDGTTYRGECCCIVGTIARARGVMYWTMGDIEPNDDRPAECWFLGISPGHTPGNSVVAAITERWILEWMEAAGRPRAA